MRPEPNLAPLPSAMQAVTSSSEANEVLVPKQATWRQLTHERCMELRKLAASNFRMHAQIWVFCSVHAVNH